MALCKSCKVKIGTGCGCCSWDFPEDSGYCKRYYSQSDVYQDKMQILLALLDRIDDVAKRLLSNFIMESEEDHEDYYLEEIVKSLKGA